jgi:hypothetical protein
MFCWGFVQGWECVGCVAHYLQDSRIGFLDYGHHNKIRSWKICGNNTQGGDLVFGVCAAIEEEKDPRCLLLVFQIVESLTLVFPDSDGPVADCAEDLFDIVSRYFPISFNPVSCSKNFATHTKSLFFFFFFSNQIRLPFLS